MDIYAHIPDRLVLFSLNILIFPQGFYCLESALSLILIILS